MKKVLIVEDEMSLTNALIDKTTGIANVFSSIDGEEAVVKGHQIKPDLVLLDLFLPKKNGLEVLEEIKMSDWGKNAKVIVFTAMDDKDLKEKCLKMGVDEYLQKSDMKISEITEKILKYIK